MKTAVIMAAGTGSRFGHYTESIPKGFIEVCGKPMVISSIHTLLSAGFEKIIIGTGYHSEYYERLAEEFSQITCCYNERYMDTNSMFTLYNCRDLILSDFLLLESDLIFEDRAITDLLKSRHDTVMLASSLTDTQDEYFIETDKNNFLLNVSPDRKELDTVSCEFVGIHRISLPYYREMCRIAEGVFLKNPQIGYEFIIRDASRKMPCKVHRIDDLAWHEIDDERDLLYAENNICQKLDKK